MRIVSTFPSGTEIVAALGLADALVGVSHRCIWPPRVRDLPKVTRSVVEGLRDPGELSRALRERRSRGLPVYEIDEALLAELDPDLIIGQEVCSVCALPAREAESAAGRLARPAESVSLEARRLPDILRNIVRVADAAGVPERGRALVEEIKRRLDRVAAQVAGADRPRVFAVEWVDPLKSSGVWLPDLIEAAGGLPVIASAGAPARAVAWDELLEAAPEVLLVMPCGCSLAETEAQIGKLAARPAWRQLPAVAAGRVFLVDGRICSKHGPRIADGVELLARLIHPEAFPSGRHAAADAEEPLARPWREAAAAGDGGAW